MKTCVMCDSLQWIGLSSEPLAPYSDYLGSDYDATGCLLCNYDCVGDYTREVGDDMRQYRAYALEGLDGVYTRFQDLDPDEPRTLVLPRASADYWAWMRENAVLDCPVCRGWGVWAYQGVVSDCLACHGQTVATAARTAWKPAFAFADEYLGQTDVLISVPRS